MVPRQPRNFAEDVPLHVIQRGNNRMPVFTDLLDYHRYLKWLGESAAETGCAIHGYVLMTNHVHLLFTPRTRDAPSLLMQHLGRKYVRWFNTRHRRTGTLWEGRFRAALVDTDGYFLSCLRYIERNPVRAGMVNAPDLYEWSSHRGNIGVRGDPLLTPHGCYLALSDDPVERGRLHGVACADDVESAMLEFIRTSTASGRPIGTEPFRDRFGVGVTTPTP